jgi:hypothetical protein
MFCRIVIKIFMGVSQSQRTATVSHTQPNRNVRARTQMNLLEEKEDLFLRRDHEALETINSLPQDSNIRQMDRFGVSKISPRARPEYKSKNPYAHEHGTFNDYYMVAEKRFRNYQRE